MFSFHKPRVYRSTEGCCICRAKSSSSRFTDSRKYESDSVKCFDLKYPRHGEICNACVLLVKRYKRLPVGSTRHWGHVVDARAGPGTKSMSKHKKSRDESGEQRTTNNTSNTSSNTNRSNGISATSNGHSSRRTQNSKSLIPEKFSKIFKKSKKSKAIVPVVTGDKRDSGAKRRSTSTTNTPMWEQHSLPTTPDSLDSDYEDCGRNGLSASGAIVQFQTQTRASSYRSRNAPIAAMATVTGATNGDAGGGGGGSASSDGTAMHRRRPLQRGSKRRKLLVPRRNRRIIGAEQDVQFFDENEWQERKTCCGMVYECAALGGALLIDVAHYQPCADHQQPQVKVPQTKQQIIATLPTVVQLSPPILPMEAVAATSLPLPLPPILSTNSTPALKKHHLFFKRQSECFPHGDLNLSSGSSNNNTSTSTQIKTESMAPASANAITIINSCSNTSNSITIPTPAIIEAATVQPSSAHFSGTIPLLSINTANITASAQMPRHSTAKITTISPPITISGGSGGGNNSSGTAGSKLMHKIKTGKIFKHSLDKFSVGVAERVKASSDGTELKSVVRAVNKSYVLTKPTTIAASVNGSANAIGGLHGPSHQQLTNATLRGVSPGSICTASSAPKFSDNSSDSGFDENMQERKSASPLQEDTERKLAARASVGNVQTMFLANGVQIQGQTQNLMLTGNEVAAKMFQNRNQTVVAIANGSMGNKGNGNLYHHNAVQPPQQQQQQYQTQQSNHPLTAAPAGVKIAQIVGTVGNGNIGAPSSSSAKVTIGSGGHLGCHAKSSPATSAVAAARAIYNNNTIQHENGVTTIVPASSLAASTQTAAMNALAPSTVTITPAPTHHLGVAVSNLNKKLTPASANVSNNPSNSFIHGAAASSSNNHNLQHHGSALNQKIILVKTAPTATKYNHNNNGNANNSKATVTAAAHNTGSVVSSAALVSLGSLNASACKN